MGRTLIRLAWSHFAVATGVLLMVAAVAWIALLPSWEDLYAREFGLPHLGTRYGFQFGAVSVTDRGTVQTLPGIVSVNSGGDLARMGVHERDIPFEIHGSGAVAMYHALLRGERGEPAEFEVVNADDLVAARDTRPLRTIRVPPRSSGIQR